MNKVITVFALLMWMGSTLSAQNMSEQDRLFWACKVWGLVKYNHSAVSVCAVNWDDVLRAHLPAIRAAMDYDSFNDGLMAMLRAAGPMDIATGPALEIDNELNLNRHFNWVHDPALRTDVQEQLDTILANFRPHDICWVLENKSETMAGWLVFPHDDPMVNTNAGTNFPTEEERLLALFKYWNILAYFHPFNSILDVPLDSTLHRSVPGFIEAGDLETYCRMIRRLAAGLNDAHVDGLTYSNGINVFTTRGMYRPTIVLRHTRDGYTVAKSNLVSPRVGDVLVASAGRTVEQWEDSLRPFISAGNVPVFHRTVCDFLLSGPRGAFLDLTFRDSTSMEYAIPLECTSTISSWFYSVDPTDTLASVSYTVLPCDIGYVNMGRLSSNDAPAMYASLREMNAIIFDLRNGAYGAAAAVVDMMLSKRTHVWNYKVPDTRCPGAFRWWDNESDLYLGTDGNPTAFEGKVIVLCNEISQSHDEWSCMALKAIPGAVVVGSQTAGADGNVCRFQLHRDYQVGYTGFSVHWPNGDPTQRIGMIPDYEVIPTAAGFRTGHDEVLEKALEIAGCPLTGVSDAEYAADTFTLEQNYPNPAHAMTNIAFTLPRAASVRVSLFDLSGRLRRVLSDSWRDAGRHQVTVSAAGLPSGWYRYVVEAEGIARGGYMTLIK
ncbi:MAG: hypothetical protein IH600_03790 [Bacteroidetes bacterium]|nr:hypothetical protein [Bacteroidota bacterium]